jgi:hypothetical protein
MRYLKPLSASLVFSMFVLEALVLTFVTISLVQQLQLLLHIFYPPHLFH